MRITTRRFAWGVALNVAPRHQVLTVTHITCKPSLSSQCVAASSSYVPVAASNVKTTQRCYATVTRPLRQSWSRERVRPWMCIKKECRVVNKAVANECEACQTRKPVLQRWKCVGCGTVNFAGVKQCKQCNSPAEKSKDFWMCADCGENNRVDELEDNSVCGFCSYDMAPRTAGQEEALRRAQEAATAQQQQQENYDSISYKEADEQFADPLDGAENLDESLRVQHPPPEPTRCISRRLKIPKVTPFVPSTNEYTKTRHSSLYRRGRFNHAVRTVTNASQVPEGPPGFDWMCRVVSCGHINPGDEENCLKCGAHVKPEEWECPMCAALNHPTRSRCFHCRTAIPVCWTCAECNTSTSIYEKTCRSCGVARPPSEPKRVSEIDMAGTALRGGVTMQRDSRRGEWYCPSCQKLNFARRMECFHCGTERPAADLTAGVDDAEDALAMAGWGAGAATLGEPGSPQRQSAPLHNNWICAHCQASNFRTRHDCWKCGHASEHQSEWPKETISPQYEHEGFQAGVGDKPAEGQMNPTWKMDRDKWTCAKCYATNFRTRTECFRCGASKMAVLAPRRTQARRPVKL